MAEKKLIALSLICIVLSVGVLGTVMMLNQKDNELQIKTDQISGLENEKLTLETQVSNIQSEKLTLETQVTTLEANVSSLQTEAASLNNEKTALEEQVSSLQTEATTLENEKSALENQVSTLEANVSSLQTEIGSLEDITQSLETQVSDLQYEVTSLEDEVIQGFNSGYDEGESEGYQVGYDEGYTQGVEDLTESGYYLRDPTYDEAIAFINSDKTDENEYTTDYVCYDFTADFNSNAFQMGYRCGFVYIEFSDSAHAIACFNTTDSGLIYVEPQTDEVVTIAIGQQYPHINQVIVDIGIIW
jgi:flagellar biosynthesis/type III secretory pathway protein FliH